MAEHKESTIRQIAVMNQKAEDNEKNIREHHDNTSLKIEEIKVERERIVEQAFAQAHSPIYIKKVLSVYNSLRPKT
jgi:hypothetical protein